MLYSILTLIVIKPHPRSPSLPDLRMDSVVQLCVKEEGVSGRMWSP